MDLSSMLSRIPVLRILIPFILGILVQRLWNCMWAPVSLIVAAIILYIILASSSRTPQQRLHLRKYFILPLATAAFALGWIIAVVHCPPHLDKNQLNDRSCTGRVSQVDYTDFMMRLTIEMLDKDLPPCKVMVTTRGCDYTILEGDVVTWQASLVEVKNSGNPGEMNYANYLLNIQGIRYEQHLHVSQLHKIGHSPTLLTRMASSRHQLQQQISNSRLTVGTQRFITAILLGNSQLIDKVTREEFSTAGVAHVLALSGLHVGFIALIIWWLLFPLDYLKMKKLRLFVTVGFIILFATFTGLQPSVIRATVMIVAVFASFIFGRRHLSLNALALAALAILVFTPSALMSVGFQLSFITVAAILILAKVPDALHSRYRVVNAATSTIVTSLVAMISTLALTAHYFHHISLLSVITNVLVLPILPVFMVLGSLFLLVISAGLHWQWLDWSLDSIYRYIHVVTSVVNSIPLSHVGGVYVSSFGVIAYFVLLAALTLWYFQGSKRHLLAAGCVLVVMLTHSLYIDYRTPRQGMIAFNSFSSTPILYFDKGKGYVWTADDEDADSTTFARYYAGFLARYNINELTFVPEDTVTRLEGAMFKPPLAHLMGHRLLAVGRGRWKQMTASSRLKLDAVIVTKRFHGTISKLQELYRFDTLIISGALHETTLDPLLHYCDSAGIPYHNLSSQGAYIIDSSQD